ncbi:sensor histidine kinase [Streptomyces thermocarboxydus]
MSFLASPPSGLPGWAVLAAVHGAVALRRRRPYAALLTASGGTLVSAAGALSRRDAHVDVPGRVGGAVRRRPARRPAARDRDRGRRRRGPRRDRPRRPARLRRTPRERFLLVLAVTAMGAAAVLLGLLVRGNRVRLAAEQAEIARTAAVAERSRIAREIHDVIGHNLSVITALATGGGVAARTSPDEAVRAFDAIGEVSRTSVREVRHVLRVLREDAGADGTP